jgi:hypothetical protein
MENKSDNNSYHLHQQNQSQVVDQSMMDSHKEQNISAEMIRNLRMQNNISGEHHVRPAIN